jgi:serine/threonine protein kinase
MLDTKSDKCLNKVKKPKLLGTADYIAPEVLKGQKHTFCLDFWSLGIIVYEFLTGSLPFHDNTADQIFANIYRGKI